MTAMLEIHPDEKKKIIGYFDVYKSILTYKKGIKTNGMLRCKKETLENFTSEEICAAALYEMTFHGYTEEKVEKEYSYLEKSFEELKF